MFSARRERRHLSCDKPMRQQHMHFHGDGARSASADNSMPDATCHRHGSMRLELRASFLSASGSEQWFTRQLHAAARDLPACW